MSENETVFWVGLGLSTDAVLGIALSDASERGEYVWVGIFATLYVSIFFLCVRLLHVQHLLKRR